MVNDDEVLDVTQIEERHLTLYRPAQSFYSTGNPTIDSINFFTTIDTGALLTEVKRLRQKNGQFEKEIEDLKAIAEILTHGNDNHD